MFLPAIRLEYGGSAFQQDLEAEHLLDIYPQVVSHSSNVNCRVNGGVRRPWALRSEITFVRVVTFYLVPDGGFLRELM